MFIILNTLRVFNVVHHFQGQSINSLLNSLMHKLPKTIALIYTRSSSSKRLVYEGKTPTQDSHACPGVWPCQSPSEICPFSDAGKWSISSRVDCD